MFLFTLIVILKINVRGYMQSILFATLVHKIFILVLVFNKKVLEKFYLFLGIELLFSLIISGLTILFSFPIPNITLSISICYILMFLTYKLSTNIIYGILSIFTFTGYLGYSVGPTLRYLLHFNIESIITIFFTSIFLVFTCFSYWVLITQKDILFIKNILIIASISLFLITITNYFLKIPTLHLLISIMFIIFSCIMILCETNKVIYKNKRNYIRGAICLYVALYNFIISLLVFLLNL